MLAVFVQRCGTNTVQFTARKGRFQKVRRIHRAITFACADQRVHFVDEQDDLTSRRSDLVQNCLQPLFEFTTVFRTGNQRTHVQRQQFLVLKAFGHITINDPQRETFDNRCFTDARFTNQHRIVFCATAKNLHRAANFLVPTDNRIDFAFGSAFGQIDCVFLQRIIAFFRSGSVRRTSFAHIVDCLVQFLCGNGSGIQRLFGLGFHHCQRHQNPFNRNETVACFLGNFLGFVQHLGGLAVQIHLSGITCHFGQFGQSCIHRLDHPFG